MTDDGDENNAVLSMLGWHDVRLYNLHPTADADYKYQSECALWRPVCVCAAERPRRRHASLARGEETTSAHWSHVDVTSAVNPIA